MSAGDGQHGRAMAANCISSSIANLSALPLAAVAGLWKCAADKVINLKCQLI